MLESKPEAAGRILLTVSIKLKRRFGGRNSRMIVVLADMTG
jgi:hypothetical protein